MENLHLKNLQTNKIIDYYISQIEKIYKRNNNFTTHQSACKIINNDINDTVRDLQALTKLLNQLFKILIIELESIDIINPEIKKYRNYTINYIQDIIHHELKEHSIKDYKLLIKIFKYEIDHLKLLKNIDINSKWIDIDYEYHYHTRTILGTEYLNIVVLEQRNHLTTLTHDLIITIDEYSNIIKDIETNHR